MLQEVYCIVVIGQMFEKEPIECSGIPTEKEIFNAIKMKGGLTARVEKRYKIVE